LYGARKTRQLTSNTGRKSGMQYLWAQFYMYDIDFLIEMLFFLLNWYNCCVNSAMLQECKYSLVPFLGDM